MFFIFLSNDEFLYLNNSKFPDDLKNNSYIKKYNKYVKSRLEKKDLLIGIIL